MDELMNSAYTFVLYALDVAPFWVALVVGILGYVLSIVARQYFPGHNDKKWITCLGGRGLFVPKRS